MQLVHSSDRPPAYSDFTHWRFEPTGDPAADGAKGRALAAEFLKWRHDAMFNPMMGFAVASIGRLNRELSALEVGFFSGLSRALVGTQSPDAPSLTMMEGGKRC